MKTSTRTLRLIAATAAAFVLMAGVAQARPLASAPPNAGTSQPAATTATSTVAAVPSDTGGGFDWTAAGIGAGTALLIVVIVGAAGMTVRGRRGVALSA